MVPTSEEYKRKKVKVNGESMTVAELEGLMRRMKTEDKIDQILVTVTRNSQRITAHDLLIKFLIGGYTFLLSLTLYFGIGFGF